MRIFIIGGNGRTGKLIIQEALEKGHTVTALVRDVATLEEREGLTIVKGTPLSQPDILTAFNKTPNSPPSAVISALNASRVSDNPWSTPLAPKHLMLDSITNVLAVMNQYKITKIAILSALGVGDSWNSLFWAMKFVVWTSNMRIQYEDHGEVERLVRGTEEVDYVIVRACRLTEGEKGVVRTWGDMGKGVGALASVSRRSVAGFLIEAVEGREWDRCTPVISN